MNLNKPGYVSKRPSLGRSKSERGLDQFDTPPIALEPLFAHDPLLAGVKTICEPFCGRGNLVIAMRERGLTVYASDIVDRGCPDSTVLDFLKMTVRPLDCYVLLSNPPYAKAMQIIEHAWRLGFAWSYFSWSRLSCTPPTGSNAFTRAATCSASTP